MSRAALKDVDKLIYILKYLEICGFYILVEALVLSL
jgi:hypothetical protein